MPIEDFPHQFRVGDATADRLRNIVACGGRERRVEPKVMDVLVALASRAGELVTRAELIDAVWGVEYGGDEGLTRAISILRKTFADLAGGRDYIETAPKRGYRLTAPVSGRLDESDAEGAEKQAGARRRGLRPRWAFWAVGGAGALALVAAATLQPSRRIAPTFLDVAIDVRRGDESIAPDAAASLEDSLKRELGLARVRQVDQDKSGLTVVVALDVAGAEARIETSRNSTPLWSRRFEAEGDPEGLIRRRLPVHVGGILSCGASDGAAIEPLTDPRLLGYFLQACDDFRFGGGFERSLETLRRAREYAPESVVAQLRYANAAAWLSGLSQSEAQRAAFNAEARDIARQTMKSHPALGRSYYPLGIAQWRAGEYAAAEKSLTEAFAREPTYSFTLNALTFLYDDLGRDDEAFDIQRRALIVDPFSPGTKLNFAEMLAERGELSQARAALAEVAQVIPQTACLHLFDIEYWWGAPEAARAMLDEGCVASNAPPDRKVCFRRFLDFRQSGDTGRLMDACSALPAIERARYLARIGEPAQAFNLLLAAGPEIGRPVNLFTPDLVEMHRLPEFMNLADKMGLVAAWLESDRWPDFCADPALPYDCREAARSIRSRNASGSGHMNE